MTIKVTAKPKPVSRAKTKSIDAKYAGDEPIVIGEMSRALNWYNYSHDRDQAKIWTLDYMKKVGYSKSDISAVRRTPNIVTTVGWLARIQANGNLLSAHNISFISGHIANMIKAAGSEETSIVATKPVVDIQARIRARTKVLLTMIECEIDNAGSGGAFDMYSFMQLHEVTPQIAGYIRDYYLPMKEEVLLDDEQVKEAYGARHEFWKIFYCSLIADCDRFINNKKTAKLRKPREKKVISAVDLIKNMKYQKEFPALKIVSVHPTEIVGCDQLWVYNTKYKKLSRYNALGPAGIQVKGTTLINYDVETSISKGLRKPDISIQQLLGSGKIAIRKFMDELMTVSGPANGRINEDTVLLKAVK